MRGVPHLRLGTAYFDLEGNAWANTVVVHMHVETVDFDERMGQPLVVQRSN